MPNIQNTYSATPEIAFAASALGRQLIDIKDAGPRSFRLIAEYVLRNPLKMAGFKIDEFSRAANVSVATLSRFARSLGLKSYPDLRSKVAEILHAGMQPTEKLKQSIKQTKNKHSAAETSLQSAVNNVQRTIQGLPVAELEKVAQILKKAEKVYVLGLSKSAHVAGLLVMGLTPFCKNLLNVVEFGGSATGVSRLMHIGERDALISISFPRYAADTLALTKFAASKKAHVVCITDSPVSPLVQFADHALYAVCEHPVMPSSVISAVAVVEAIVSTLMVSDRSNIDKAERLAAALTSFVLDPSI